MCGLLTFQYQQFAFWDLREELSLKGRSIVSILSHCIRVMLNVILFSDSCQMYIQPCQTFQIRFEWQAVDRSLDALFWSTEKLTLRYGVVQG